MNPVQRVVATPAALALIAQLQARHGAIFFYQSHGCCDGSTPMCFAPGEMSLGSGDVLYATLGADSVAPAGAGSGAGVSSAVGTGTGASTPAGATPARGVPYWADRRQAAYLQGSQILLDVGQGSLGTFSLEDGMGLHFKASTRLWNDAESAWLAAHPLG